MSRKDPEKPQKPASDAEKRKARLAEALRANLKRRKATRLKPPSERQDGSGE
jgi:hypothetical protein